MKKILNALLSYKKLNKNEAHEVLVKIAKGEYNEAQIAAFITVYLMRSVSLEELQGFREALLELCVPISFDGQKTIDVCGTGGDGKNTFNISTTSAFVIAGAGYKVSKHGNYGVSSFCGSSNVLEHLGHQFTADEGLLKQQMDEANICFLHAPMFHPALKSVGQIRRQLGIKTFFNMLGPLVNPARPSHQLVGVFDLKLARMYQYILQDTDVNYQILHAIDGYDEVTLTDQVKIISNNTESLASASDLGFEQIAPESIFGGKDISDAAVILTNILSNKATQAQTNVVLANAALAIKTYHNDQSLADCVAEARESIVSGKAMTSLQKMISIQAN